MRTCAILAVCFVSCNASVLVAADPVRAKVQPVGLFELPRGDSLLGFTFSQDGKTLLASGSSAKAQGVIHCWDVKSRKLLHSLRDLASLSGPLATASDDKKLIAGALSDTGNVLVRGGPKWQDESTYLLDSKSDIKDIVEVRQKDIVEVRQIVVANDGRRMLTESGVGVHLWDLKGKPAFSRLNTQPELVGGVAFSPNSDEVAVMYPTVGVDFFDTRGKATGKLPVRDDDIGIFRSVAYSPNGKLIATGWYEVVDPDGPGGDKRRDEPQVTAILWDAATRKELLRFKGEQAFATNLAFTADSRYLIQLANPQRKDDSQRICICDVKSGKRMIEFETGCIGSNRLFALSKDGKHLVTRWGNDALKLWSIEDIIKNLDKKDK